MTKLFVWYASDEARSFLLQVHSWLDDSVSPVSLPSYQRSKKKETEEKEEEQNKDGRDSGKVRWNGRSGQDSKSETRGKINVHKVSSCIIM